MKMQKMENNFAAMQQAMEEMQKKINALENGGKQAIHEVMDEEIQTLCEIGEKEAQTDRVESKQTALQAGASVFDLTDTGQQTGTSTFDLMDTCQQTGTSIFGLTDTGHQIGTSFFKHKNRYQQTDLTCLGRQFWPVKKIHCRDVITDPLSPKAGAQKELKRIPPHEQLIQSLSRPRSKEEEQEEDKSDLSRLLSSGIWGKRTETNNSIEPLRLCLAENDFVSMETISQSIEILEGCITSTTLHLLKPEMYQGFRTGFGMPDHRFTKFAMKTTLIFPIKDGAQGKCKWSLLIILHTKAEKESYLTTKNLESSFKVYVLDPLFQVGQACQRKSDCVFSYINSLAKKKKELDPEQRFKFELQKFSIVEENVSVPTSTPASSGLHIIKYLKAIVEDPDKFLREIKQKKGHGRNTTAFESEMRKDVFGELYKLQGNA